MENSLAYLADQNASVYSNLYKILNGVCPDLARFRALTLDEQQEEIEHISATLEEISADDEPDPWDYYDDRDPPDDPYTSSGPDYWRNDAGEWRCG